MVPIALGVKLASPGPILFPQQLTLSMFTVQAHSPGVYGGGIEQMHGSEVIRHECGAIQAQVAPSR